METSHLPLLPLVEVEHSAAKPRDEVFTDEDYRRISLRCYLRDDRGLHLFIHLINIGHFLQQDKHYTFS